jgi:hypothetical protein
MAKKSAPKPPGPLGFIIPSERTPAQEAAHARAMAGMPRFFMSGYTDPPVGTKVMLTDFWKAPEVVADLGQEFTGFGQYTGSCVGVSEGNAVTTMACVLRVIAGTKAVACWWPFPYGRTRYNEGDRGQGEGAVDSVMGETLVREGWFETTQDGLPAFKAGPDGWWLTKQLEYQWSDGGSGVVTKWAPVATRRAGIYKSAISNVQEIRAAVLNGYAVLDGCDNYVGTGRVKGTGASAYAVGRYDGRGGHSTCYLAVWNHPTDGWLYGYSNQWQTSTYPKDPAGLGRCCVWVPESEVEKLFRTGGDRGETMALSLSPGTPLRPEVLSWVP